MYEFDKIYLEKQFGGVAIHKLFYLFDKIKQMLKYRDECLEFLFKVFEREVTIIFISFNAHYSKSCKR
jgi:hypothetical protein